MTDYSDRIVCFIDILGWQHEVEAIVLSGGNIDIDQLSRINRAVDRIESVLSETSGMFPSGFDVTHFSDSLIVSCPIETKGAVFQLLNRLQILQTDLVREGLLLRGGIAVGKACHTQNRVFGAGVNEAYRLESKEAKYPRIVISSDVTNAVGNGLGLEHSTSEEIEYINELVSMDSDGFCIVDYFLKTADNFDPPEAFCTEYLPKLKEIVSTGLASTDPLVVAKYEWLKGKVDLIK